MWTSYVVNGRQAHATTPSVTFTVASLVGSVSSPAGSKTYHLSYLNYLYVQNGVEFDPELNTNQLLCTSN